MFRTEIIDQLETGERVGWIGHEAEGQRIDGMTEILHQREATIGRVRELSRRSTLVNHPQCRVDIGGAAAEAIQLF